jgi:beta-lactam-binding protein with PASTA domain
MVDSTNPSAGSRVGSGDSITIEVSNGSGAQPVDPGIPTPTDQPTNTPTNPPGG